MPASHLLQRASIMTHQRAWQHDNDETSGENHGCMKMLVRWTRTVVSCVVLSASAVGMHEARAAEPEFNSAAADQLRVTKVRWVEKRRQQIVREQILRTDRLTPRWRALADSVWRDKSQNGFSLDVDPGDDEIILKYRVRF
jgi:hypothetical protein